MLSWLALRGQARVAGLVANSSSPCVGGAVFNATRAIGSKQKRDQPDTMTPRVQDILKEIEDKKAFRFGFSEEDLTNIHPLAKKTLSFENAARPEINQWKISEQVKKFQTKEGDTGRTEVQVAVLTEKIKYMTDHMREHPKDFHSRRGLEHMVAKRRKLLKYLKREHIDRYNELIPALGIRHVR